MSVVLVGVDKSDSSRHAVAFAARLASQLGLSLLVAHVIPWSPYSFSTPGENERRAQVKEEEIAAATEQLLDPMAAMAREAGVEVDTAVRHGDPVDVLIELGKDRDAEMIVVGRTGDSRMRRALFGSIPGHLVQEPRVPVIVAP